MKRTLTTSQVAKALGVNPSTIRKWSRKGKIDFEVQPDGSRLYSEAAVKRFRERPTMATKGKKGSRTYTFSAGPDEVTLSEEDFARLTAWYSNADGDPRNQDEVCAEFKLLRRELQIILRASGLTHTSLPYTDDQILEGDEEDLVEGVLLARKQRLYRKVDERSRRQDMEAAAKWYRKEDELRALAASLAEGVYVPTPRTKPVMEPLPSEYLAVIVPTDLHFGKYGSATNGPGAYTKEVAKRRVMHHVRKALANLDRFCPRGYEVLVLVGSDGCHIDNVQGGTTRGTPQDVDGVPVDVARDSVFLWAEVVDTVLAESAAGHVTVRGMPGNHDRLVTHMTMAALTLAYREHPNVKVVPTSKFYDRIMFGRNLIFWAHGDGRHSTKDLAHIAATHWPEDWGFSLHRIAVRGNLHHLRDEAEVGIRNMLWPSLSGSDEYHQKHWAALVQPMLRTPVLHARDGIQAIFESGPCWNASRGDWDEV